MVTGGIIIAAIMLLVFPVLIMFGGAIWSAVFGWTLVEDADARAEALVHGLRGGAREAAQTRRVEDEDDE